LVGLPISAYGIRAFSKIFRKEAFRYLLMGVVLLVMLFFSARIVIYSGNESIRSVNATVDGYYLTRDKVTRHIEANAILMVDRSDKIFWPDTPVISYLGNDSVFPEVKLLIEHGYPVYYYLHTKISPELESSLSREILPKYGLSLEQHTSFPEGDFLYALKIESL
ncbi:MAG TPA: hypothetical protein VJA22_01415, partial [Patescibacteria group bacterium]|nr:hypothetical protein [Patescibacteria group bacterium]